MCKNSFEGNIYVRSMFSCVRSSHDLCAHAHMHSLEGTLINTTTITIIIIIIIVISFLLGISVIPWDYMILGIYILAKVLGRGDSMKSPNGYR